MNAYVRNISKKLKFHIATVLIAGIMLLLPSSSSASDVAFNRAADTRPYRILCISSYNYSYPTVPDQLNGLAAGLGNLHVDIDYEFIDAKNYYKSADYSAFHDYLKYKIQKSDPFDLLVLCDDTAMHFGINYYEELFRDLPVIFTSVNSAADAEVAAARRQVTGSIQSLDFEANFKLIRELFPQRTQFVLIIDNTSTAQGEYTEFQKFMDHQPEDRMPDVTVINASNYSKAGLERAISEHNTNKNIILYLSCLEDGEGHIFSLNAGTSLIANSAPDVPIWRFTLADMQQGVLGGIAYSYYDASVKAGETAAKILTGESPDNFPVESNIATHAYFDQTQLDRFNIDIDDLPEDATIINEHPTLRSIYRANRLPMNLMILSVLLMITIIVILIIVNRQRTKLIHQDFLTQMPNRPYIVSKMSSLMDSKTPFGLIMMDVDHFKNVNDSLGHLVGDVLLMGVAERLKTFPEKEVIFARIGGDEFMGLIFDGDKKTAERLCQELIAKMEEPFDVSAAELHVTISAGAAVYPTDTDNPHVLANYADAALYEVKKKGRNGYQMFHPSLLKNIGRST